MEVFSVKATLVDYYRTFMLQVDLLNGQLYPRLAQYLTRFAS